MEIQVKNKGSKKMLVAFKIYFDRARMYLGYINFFILNLVLINSFDNATISNFIGDHKYMVIPLMFIIYLVLLIFIGYLDTKLGLRQEEMRNNALVNPVLQDLLRTVKDIQSEVRKSGNKTPVP